MSFIIETGAGTPGATAYCSVAFVTAYLTDQNREEENTWATIIGGDVTRGQEAIVAATLYLDKRHGPRIKSQRLRDVIPGRAASGTFTFAGQPSDTNTVVVGQVTYRFVATLAQENDVLIGATAADTVDNLVAAIVTGGSADGVHEDTRPNYEAGATANDDGDEVEVGALVAGENGNEIVLTQSADNVTVTGSGKLTGGIDQGPQPREFPRLALYSREGVRIVGVPLKVKQATAEYAVRALASSLEPDPTIDDRNMAVQRKREKFGPFEEETEYVEGARIQIHRPYPAADRLLEEYLVSGSAVIR